MERIFAGIDMGGTNTVIALVNEHGEILSRDSIKTSLFDEPHGFAEAVAQKIFKLSDSIKLNVNAIGIGAPNGNFYAGTIEFAPNLKWKGVIPLASMIEKQTGISTMLTNDANAAALGEMIFGGAKSMKDFIVITLGTGVGSGIVAGGNLVYGHHGFAGEAGHMIIYPEGRECACGRRGCFETYCNASGIVKTYCELANILYDEGLTSKQIAELAAKGNYIALETYRQTGNVLGIAIANCICMTNPEAVFLFGGIINAGELLLRPTLKSLEMNILPLFKGKTKILRSELPLEDAAVLGAASICFRQTVN